MIMRFGRAGSCWKIYHVYEGCLWRMDRQWCACELTSMAVGQARAETEKNVCFYLFGGWECSVVCVYTKNANASLHANDMKWHLTMKCQEWQSTYETLAAKNGSTWWDARPTERLVARRTEVIKGICACKSLGKNWDRCVGWGVLGTTQAVSYQKNVGWRFRGAGHCCCCCCRWC